MFVRLPACAHVCVRVRVRVSFVPWALKGPLSSTFLRPNGEFLFEKWFRSRRTFNAATCSFVLPFFQSSLVLCKRRSSGATASERARRPPIRQRKSSWKNPWETGEREKNGGSERYSSYVAKATREGGGTTMRENGRLDCHTRLESKTYKFYVAATSIAPSIRYDYRGGARRTHESK